MSGQVGHARAAEPSAEPSPAPLPAGLRSSVVPGIAVLLAAVLLVAVALAAVQSDVAGARTQLAEGAEVTATLADGTTTSLAVGDEVPDGATVAAPAGAVLRTRDRDVLLGRQTRVTVVDGARQVLEAGFVMVDARRGPGVDVETPAAVVTTPEGAVSRVEPGAVLRVGAFSGEPVQVRASGRRATADVDALYQVQVPVGGLPSRVTPLALTGDAYEHRLASDLLAADRALRDLARTLDSRGDQGPAVLTALRTALPAVAAGDPGVLAASPASPASPASSAPAAPRSEPALAFLLAAAPELEDGRLAERYTEVRGLRTAGGSWGVVAALVDTRVAEVSSLLDRLLAPVVLVAGEAPVSDVVALLTSPAGAASGSAGAGGATTADGTPPSGTSPSGLPPDAPPPAEPPPAEPPPPGPPPPPPPPEDPVGTVIETVEVVVDTVIGLLPDPPPPASTPTPAVSVPEAVDPVSDPVLTD